jgi:hypothetical protein
VVRGEDDHTLVEALNPQTMVQLTGRKDSNPSPRKPPSA